MRRCLRSSTQYAIKISIFSNNKRLETARRYKFFNDTPSQSSTPTSLIPSHAQLSDIYYNIVISSLITLMCVIIALSILVL